MKEGDIVLAPLPQSDGAVKNRPVLLLRELPPFGDFLSCGVSTQVQHTVPEFDETINDGDPDFSGSGLRTTSLIRLGFLSVLARKRILGSIGEIGASRYARLLRNLSRHLEANLKANQD